MTLKFTALLFVLFSVQTFATGSIYCKTEDQSIEFYGATARAFGNPLVGDLLVNTDEQTESFPKAQVVGYWNMGEDLKFAVVDEEALRLQYVVEAKRVKGSDDPLFTGTVTFSKNTVRAVLCEL